MNVFKSFPRTFGIANIIELFERWAWYGFFMLFANYLTGSTETGALGFSQAQKGMIMGFGTAILYFLPLVTGAIADRYGYKRVLLFAFIIYSSAFILLPMFDTFTSVFLMYLYLAVGAALFKPVISATIAKTTNEHNSSIGFGIFYMMVNLGAFFGPLFTLLFVKDDYSWVFYISAAMVSVNFIMLFFYKEPARPEVQSSFGESMKTVFRNIYVVLKDLKFVVFLLLVAGFWTMYNQLFYTLPVFIEQWVDTSVIYSFFTEYMPVVADKYGQNGQMMSEFIVNFDALYIIIFQILVSSVVMKLKPLNAMMAGFLVCSIGMALTLFSDNGIFTLVAILIFAVGEMAGSPKITEYLGRIAPPDKVALYMGCSFLPVFVGNIFAGYISGFLYGAMSDKDTIVRNEVTKRGLEISESLTKNEYFAEAASRMQMSAGELTQYLWAEYNPSSIWIVVLSIGLLSTFGLFVYDRFLAGKGR